MYRTLLGAIVGFTVGLLFKSPLAAGACLLVGAFIGFRFDTAAADPADFAPLPPPEPLDDVEQRLLHTVTETRTKKQFTGDVCALFVSLAKVDGELVREEVRAARQFFEEDLGFSAPELEEVRLAIKAALAKPLSLDEAAERCTRTMTQTERVLLINALFEVALSDGPLSTDEERMLTEAADALKIPPSDLRTVFEMHLGTGEEHYRVLGLTSDVSDDALKRAYKRLVVLHHPDRVAHLGAVAAERASERFRDLQRAWEHIRKVRGL